MEIMKQISFLKRHYPYLYLCRRISSDIWAKDLNIEIRHQIEEYWSGKLENENTFNKNLNDKFYVLSMFPYPSGNLHMGHVRVYTISDTIARFHRMNGKNVFQPMGWDAFGLPAENAALERNVEPRRWTESNIEQMRHQLKRLRCSFDWDSEITTCSPEYYKWTQFLFLKLYEAGLAYKKEAIVNWDPVDETVLADEQVDEEGRSWRSGAIVEKKILKQWFIKTTKFAKNLYDGLSDDALVHWNDIIDIQKNWIGECNGYSFDFKVKGKSNEDLTVLNTWVAEPKMISHAKFLCIKPNSLLDILVNDGNTGVERLLDVCALNAVTNKPINVYVSDHVQYQYGRDVYIGIPQSSAEDEEFAKQVGLNYENEEELYDDQTILDMAVKGNFGGFAVSSKLKDWLISRQRYWGTPIPIVECSHCGIQPVPADSLPVVLPSLPDGYEINKKLHKFLKNSEWRKTTCPKCGNEASRETDTMDTFVDSSWYYLRYLDPKNQHEPFSKEIVDKMMPVDIYVGGKEHAALHLYYARFMNHFLHSIGLVNEKEPFRRLLTQGMVKGKTFKTLAGHYVRPENVKMEGKKALNKDTGEFLEMAWEKMSKSKYNGIDPNDVLQQYGVDTTRLFILFSVAPMSHRNWNSELFPDVIKWQHRLWLTIREFINVRRTTLECVQPWLKMEEENKDIMQRRNFYIKGTTYQYKYTHQLASAFTHLQGFSNILRCKSREVRKYSKEYERALAELIIMLGPMAPHFSATLWQGFLSAENRLNADSDFINWNGNVLEQKWPQLDNDYNIPIIFNINPAGVKYTVSAPKNEFNQLDLEKALECGKSHIKVQRILAEDSEIDRINFEHIENYRAKVDIYLKRTYDKKTDENSDDRSQQVQM